MLRSHVPSSCGLLPPYSSPLFTGKRPQARSSALPSRMLCLPPPSPLLFHLRPVLMLISPPERSSLLFIYPNPFCPLHEASLSHSHSCERPCPLLAMNWGFPHLHCLVDRPLVGCFHTDPLLAWCPSQKGAMSQDIVSCLNCPK